ncbi:hypothetical protein [Belliella pelovolcani]|uniref:hypothetical protein n=1 Tax=Belliella pelovolcani TaxID=529505 RepID=UPI00391B1169
MRKYLIALSIIGVSYLSFLNMSDSSLKAQTPGIEEDCWNTITEQKASMALYCGTCTYIKNSKPSAFAGSRKCTPTPV